MSKSTQSSVQTPLSVVDRRFWIRVEPLGACWIWTGAKVWGYGVVGFNGKQWKAHRYAYTRVVGPIPEGMELDHLCKTKPCVRPSHLEAVTRAENNRRSNSPTARNARKTHCKWGHAFTPENIERDENGHRQCVTCRTNRFISPRKAA